MENCRYEIKITGIVQGVGFRPFIYALAKSLSLNGWINNAGAGVIIEVEGRKKDLDIFLKKLSSEAPPLSCIKDIHVEKKPNTGFDDFVIMESSKAGEENIYISPDVSICSECRNELFDRSNRRCHYPFINCTNCGPRFTIIAGVPYDRVNTTMGMFEMCMKCSSEYGSPGDRRYHAQPVSCHDCGPRLELFNRNGEKIKTDDILNHTCRLLSGGSIIAVKGLGGYHLVCNAREADTVSELRRRKMRDDKPFALMVKDCETALEHCLIEFEEKRLLKSQKKPIVLLKKKEECRLPDEIAPGNPYLGLMLPYTPVHLLLFQNDIDTLVVTSGNKSSEPIYYKDDEAYENLRNIADFFLTNNREIYTRTDDSVTRIYRGREYIIRRSRGYVPLPVTCEAVSSSGCRNGKANIPSVLACGGELKNTFCLNRGKEFYLSHHIGDLENVETLASFEDGIKHFKKMFDIEYKIVAFDLHTGYLSTKYALSCNLENKVAVQHHHAHIASCMAENNLEGNVIGVAFDGAGYGYDGNMWGGEFLSGSCEGFTRAGHLEYVGMPGGDMAVKEPWRMALSYLYGIYPDLRGKIKDGNGIEIDGVRYLDGIEGYRIRTVLQMLDRKLNCPLTSSMGRLFDAVSALLGIRNSINYEGQAAIELEYITDGSDSRRYRFSIEDIDQVFIVKVEETIKDIIEDIKNKVDRRSIAARFHETVADIVLEACKGIRNDTGFNRAVLSGGVFQNIILLEKCVSKLEEAGFKAYIHSKVPANDGGIALGQAVIAIKKYNVPF